MRSSHALGALAAAGLLAVTAAPATAQAPGAQVASVNGKPGPAVSGPAAQKDQNFTTGLTECPHAGDPAGLQPRPLERRRRDRVEELSGTGDDRRVNQDFACFPQDETSIEINPRNARNAVAGANDYRLGFATSGFFATTDGGDHWYDGIIPFPSLPNGDNLDGGGDPAIAYDRTGVAYYAEINFNRTDDTNGIFVSRSTNGGFTWTRACVPVDTTPGTTSDDAGVCGGPGDVRRPGDGVVVFSPDDDTKANGSVPFHDKEYLAAGPRPDGVAARCFGAFTRNSSPCPDGTVSPDRLHVTWTMFGDDARILHSYSDDSARSWSPPKEISGDAPFCVGGGGNRCNFNQFSVPTVNRTTGHLYVGYQNFNTPDENQYLVVRSTDGGQSFGAPRFVTPVYDANFPRSGSTRPDCAARGQQNGRAVLTNSCFRVFPAGNIVVDPRGGRYADDLYIVLSDNRNGTRVSSNTDTFLFKSVDGGASWVGPTRVNDDASRAPADRDCEAGDEGCADAFGNDQWFSWVDVSHRGDVVVAFYDRRLDRDSTAHEWPMSRQRPGNYLVWRFAARCSTGPADSRGCVAPEASVIPQPVGPVDPGPGPQPGSSQATFPLRNGTLSDVPSNWDYTFRAGIFAGDYDVVAIGPDNTVWAVWTDARNGRSSRQQAGRNPICEQSDVFLDTFKPSGLGEVGSARSTDALFLVTPCPAGTGAR